MEIGCKLEIVWKLENVLKRHGNSMEWKGNVPELVAILIFMGLGTRLMCSEVMLFNVGPIVNHAS